METIEGIKANDILVFGGYPIATEGVVGGSDTTTLTDGTVITLVGFGQGVLNLQPSSRSPRTISQLSRSGVRRIPPRVSVGV